MQPKPKQFYRIHICHEEFSDRLGQVKQWQNYSHPVAALLYLRISLTKVPWHALGIQELLRISDSIIHKPLHAQVSS